MLEETSEIVAHRVRHGRLPLVGLEPIGTSLETLEHSGGSSAPGELRPILNTARAASAVRRALAKVESAHLARRRDALPDFEDLLSAARQLFDADGSVRDDASPKLSALRTQLRRRRAQVTRELTKLLETRRDYLGDSVVVVRNDRYCLPVVASARARVPGIVHDRSGSGQTVFLEPLEIIESNNELALLAGQERREVDRLVTEFGREVLSRADQLEEAMDQLAQLDALEAKAEFGELSEGRFAELSDDGGWTLRAARHPLLDSTLAPLRRRILGETRETRSVVPLDLDLPREKRMLVVSGPNAGGKTVVLKTAGLFSLLTQSGIPVPAGPGTRLPVFRSIQTEIGDAQAILSDRSTFSSSVETLARTLRDAGPDTLALVDEIGGATDPEEGSALAVAWLEAFLSRGGRAIVSTHLAAIKGFASDRTDSVCAAMEFDEETGRPNYRLRPGLSGRSRALSVAREHGLPEPVVERAEALLGEAWKRRQQLEADAEETIARLRHSERELQELRHRASEEAERLSSERKQTNEERTRMLQDGLARFDNAGRELARKVALELAAIRQDSTRRASDSADTIMGEAERAVLSQTGLDAAREEVQGGVDILSVGARVRWRGKTEGVVVSLEEGAAWIEVAGKRLRVSRSDLEAASHRPLTRRAGRTVLPDQTPTAVPSEPTREVNVIGQRLDEAIAEVEKRLDEALVAGAGRLRIVHGHGTGRLRDGLREHFRHYPGVASLKAADPREGGNGATIVELS
jgi:DNA mismatch repair protein MutS2